MGLLTNAKVLLNTLFLSGTEIAVNKTFGNYENAAQAQADVNLLAAFMDAGVTRKHFSKRAQENVLTIEEIFGEEPQPKPVEKPKPEDMREAFLTWFKSLDDENKKFIKDALK